MISNIFSAPVKTLLTYRHRTWAVRLAIVLLTCVFVEMEGLESMKQSSPEVFAPGVISGIANNLAPAFTPDCQRVYFGRSNGADNVILVSDLAGDHWTPPRLAAFSGIWRDLEPSMSPDGSRLVFASNRPPQQSGRPLDGNWGGKARPSSGGSLWYVERQGSAWSEPHRLPDTVNSSASVFSPSVAANGNVYFMKPSEESGRFHIYKSEFKNGQYQPPERLPFTTDEQWSDVDPAVAVDESFLVFSSSRPPTAASGDLDLFIVFRKDGTWGQPQHLGAVINSPTSEIEARLAPDGHTLYFSSTRTFAVTYPKTPVQATESLKQMSTWNTGLNNIWHVDISSWLEGAGLRAPQNIPACTPR
jgi:Tol biopolymer transport system component